MISLRLLHQLVLAISVMKGKQFELGRRGFLLSGLGAGISGMAQGAETGGESSEDEGAFAWKRNPNVYHFRIGEVGAWTISDAFFPLRKGLGLMWPETDRGEMEALLKREGRVLDSIPLHANVLVLKAGSEVMLFDSGFGGEGKGSKGWLKQGLAQIGIRPEQVTAGFLSHAHSDHLNGFVADEKPLFPNAAFYLLSEELAFWQGKDPDFSRSKRDAKQIPGMIASVRKHFEILSGNMTVLNDGDEVFGGLVRVELAPGHTVGHACFRIRSGGAELLHLMDLAHHDLLMFANPNWTIGFDHEPKLAVETRKRFWARAATKGTRCYGFHLPWPGVGRILKENKGYRWAAEPWEWGL